MTDSELSQSKITQFELDQAEKSLRMKLVDFSHLPELQAQIGEAFYIWKNDPESISDYISEEDVDNLIFAKFFDWFIYDFKLLDTEKRVIEKFYEEESEELTDIEKDLLYDWLDNLYSFFEVEELTPKKEGYRVRDLFTGEIHYIKDSASSRQVAPSDIVAARLLGVGENTYVSGVISVYPQAVKPVIFDFFKREFDEYKKTFGRKRTAKEYLKDWGYLIGNHLEDMVKKPYFSSPEGGEFVFASATYDVEDFEGVLELLKDIEGIQEIESGTDELRVFSWTSGEKNSVSGIIEAEKDSLAIQCYSKGSLDGAKELLENRMAGLITHKEDSVREPESFLDKKSTGKKKDRKRSIKAKNNNVPDKALDEYYEGWIDKPLEALKGRTPRQALQTEQGRENLDSVLRELESFYRRAMERGEPYYDVSKLVKKLKNS